jgi:hypothetical protein
MILKSLVRPKIVRAAGFLITAARRTHAGFTPTRQDAGYPARPVTPSPHSKSSGTDTIPVNFEGPLKSSAAAVPAVADKGRPGMAAENERLRKRLAKAEVKLGQTRAALDIMGKAFALLEMFSESADSPKPSAR